jgi:hypothetical protein
MFENPLHWSTISLSKASGADGDEIGSPDFKKILMYHRFPEWVTVPSMRILSLESETNATPSSHWAGPSHTPAPGSWTTLSGLTSEPELQDTAGVSWEATRLPQVGRGVGAGIPVQLAITSATNVVAILRCAPTPVASASSAIATMVSIQNGATTAHNVTIDHNKPTNI